ncbi:MAG: metal ABC transporter substrate-binding protein [Candidatus Izemoplasmatales bacterium]|jgi:zinc transport system substrate-binding protein
MRKILLTLMAIVIAILLSACEDTATEHEVFVTVYPLEYIVERLFEGTPYTVGIVPGVTSHSSSVDWSPKEIISMTKADYLFYVGANYDQYIDLQINSIFQGKEVELVKLENNPDYITFILGLVHDHDHDHDPSDEGEVTTTAGTEQPNTMLGYDPHFWISPLRVKQAAMLVYDKLIAKYPAEQSTIEDNYESLIDDLDDLGAAFLETIGAQKKPLMTSTNIYGYLREDYGLSYIPISPGYHEETEQFTSAEKEAIVAKAVKYDICHIIFERNVSSPLSNAAFDALVALGMSPVKLEYDILQMLSKQDRENGDDYLSVMYKNLQLIETAADIETEQEE